MIKIKVIYIVLIWVRVAIIFNPANYTFFLWHNSIPWVIGKALELVCCSRPQSDTNLQAKGASTWPFVHPSACPRDAQTGNSSAFQLPSKKQQEKKVIWMNQQIRGTLFAKLPFFPSKSILIWINKIILELFFDLCKRLINKLLLLGKLQRTFRINKKDWWIYHWGW